MENSRGNIEKNREVMQKTPTKTARYGKKSGSYAEIPRLKQRNIENSWGFLKSGIE